jgi:hypothetical protein
VPVLVSVADLKLYLGDAPASADDVLLGQLIDDVEALFASETGRDITSFRDAGTGRVEVLDGTGSRDLYLDYPIAALTSITLGYDASVPDETLLVTDKNVIVYAVGGRKITRTDGGLWGRAGQPRYVTVTYNYGADLPDSASLAIKSVTAMAYRRRGSESEKSETVGSFYSHTMVNDAAVDDPYWTAAVVANRRTLLV